MRKLNNAKKVIVGGMLVVSMIGTATLPSFADAKVGTDVIKELRHDSKKMAKESFFFTSSAERAVKKSDAIEDMIKADNKYVTKAYDSALRCALLGAYMSDNLGISHDNKEAMSKYLVKLNAYYLAKAEGKKATMPKLAKATLNKMYDVTDILLATLLMDEYSTEYKVDNLKFLAKYTDSIRKDRVKRTDGDKIAGLYLDIASMFKYGANRGSSKHAKGLYGKYRASAEKGIEVLKFTKE